MVEVATRGRGGGVVTVWTARDLTVVVPVAPGDVAWRDLWADLAAIHGQSDVVFSGPVMPEGLPPGVRWVASPLGRARQLNAGAAAARGAWLLFLHADSRLGAGWWQAVEDAVARAPHALSFFRLSFASDGPRLTWLNAALANARASVLGMPFGDQGFLLARAVFEALGRFDTHVPYGEDHLLAWRARQRGAALQTMRATVTTSARKYERLGWGRVTRGHVRATVAQAVPEAVRLVSQRLAPRRPSAAAVACFVKTPGLSQVKTRLAADVGRARADEIFAASVASVEALLLDCASSGISVAWAVAETEGLRDPRWSALPRVAQGAGGLGDRQSVVYDRLLAAGRTPVLTGADVPHLWRGRVEEAVARLTWCDFVAGEATDGGYYLFAGRRPIPREVWNAVRYSESDTLDQLEAALRPLGHLERLPALSDLDRGCDLARVADEVVQSHAERRSAGQEASLQRLLAVLRG